MVYRICIRLYYLSRKESSFNNLCKIVATRRRSEMSNPALMLKYLALRYTNGLPLCIDISLKVCMPIIVGVISCHGAVDR